MVAFTATAGEACVPNIHVESKLLLNCFPCTVTVVEPLQFPIVGFTFLISGIESVAITGRAIVIDGYENISVSDEQFSVQLIATFVDCTSTGCNDGSI